MLPKMKNKTISIGHKNPDTDSVLSAFLVSKYGEKIFGTEVEAAIADDINNETKYIIEALKISKPMIKKRITDENVIILDTTEPGQIVEGLNENNLYGIIDHHNMGGLKSSKPIYARIEPLGCTCSIVYKIMREKKVRVDKNSAVMIISAIISDTLNFNSPTATNEDKKIMEELNKTIGLDIDAFAKTLFAAKSSLEGITINDIANKDYKVFDMGASKVGIGVWETTSPETLNSQKDRIIEALIKKKIEEKLNYIYFAVIDIITSNAYLYIIDNEENVLAKEAFGSESKDNIIFLKGVVSRKKQIVPPLQNKLLSIQK